jgi:hypothetical protein
MQPVSAGTTSSTAINLASKRIRDLLSARHSTR